MGASNALMVSANWKHLGHREHRLLTFMALVSLDTDRPPVYFGGWQAGAEHLGLDPAVNPDSAAESFRQAISKLKRAGAVVPNGIARQGNRAEYALALNPALTAVPTVTRNGTGRPVTTWSVVHRQDPRPHASPNGPLPLSPNDPLGHQPQRPIGVSPNDPLPPRRTEEPRQDYRKEDRVESQPVSPAPEKNSGTQMAEGIDSDVYAAASAYLQARPMQHLTLMERAEAELGPNCSVRRQVITAAQLGGWQPQEAAA